MTLTARSVLKDPAVNYQIDIHFRRLPKSGMTLAIVQIDRDRTYGAAEAHPESALLTAATRASDGVARGGGGLSVAAIMARGREEFAVGTRPFLVGTRADVVTTYGAPEGGPNLPHAMTAPAATRQSSVHARKHASRSDITRQPVIR
jgi:hypothetical protein